MTARAAAETARLSYFEKVLSVWVDYQTSSIPLPLLQLEYFRRYQLDVERSFYRNRGTDHRKAAAKLLNLSSFAVALGSVARGLAGFLGGALGRNGYRLPARARLPLRCRVWLQQTRLLARNAGTKNVTNACLRLSTRLLVTLMTSGDRQRREHENLCSNS